MPDYDAKSAKSDTERYRASNDGKSASDIELELKYEKIEKRKQRQIQEDKEHIDDNFSKCLEIIRSEASQGSNCALCYAQSTSVGKSNICFRYLEHTESIDYLVSKLKSLGYQVEVDQSHSQSHTKYVLFCIQW